MALHADRDLFLHDECLILDGSLLYMHILRLDDSWYYSVSIIYTWSMRLGRLDPSI